MQDLSYLLPFWSEVQQCMQNLMTQYMIEGGQI